MGKGDNRRPMRITKEEYDANWEAAFVEPSESESKSDKQVPGHGHEGPDLQEADGRPEQEDKE